MARPRQIGRRIKAAMTRDGGAAWVAEGYAAEAWMAEAWVGRCRRTA